MALLDVPVPVVVVVDVEVSRIPAVYETNVVIARCAGVMTLRVKLAEEV
jgi:hypothetical protein